MLRTSVSMLEGKIADLARPSGKPEIFELRCEGYTGVTRRRDRSGKGLWMKDM
jgi:hypothetical protein